MRHPKQCRRIEDATRFETREDAAGFLSEIEEAYWVQQWPDRQVVKRGTNDYVIALRERGPYIEVRR